MVKWDAWHQERKDRYARQREDRVSGQRRWLESQLGNQERRERYLALEQGLKGLEQPDQATASLSGLGDVLNAAPTTEQRQLIGRICKAIQAHYGGRPLGPPLPEALLALLRLLSGYTRGPAPTGLQHQPAISLEGLDLTGLQIDKLDLRGASLKQCRFAEARLNGLNLFAARLEAVSFAACQLEGADLTGATLIGVSLAGTDLRQAELIRAELRDCDLRGAKLAGVTLRGARLAGSDLRGADLSEVRDLSFQQLLSCRLDAATRLPDSLSGRLNELLAKQVPQA